MTTRKAFLLLIGLLSISTGARAAEWKLCWSDEFNYQGLPDPAKWSYEEGFIRNHESQYYTRGRLENARVENGMLVIECRKEHFKPANHDAVEYTSASINTRNKESWQYGRIEMRAKLPEGKGVWPALWMLGTNISQVGWPACGEIDIMESVGKDPDKVFGTLHYKAKGKHEQDGTHFPFDKPYADFHIYAVEWYPDRIDFYFDGTKYHTVLTDKVGQGADNPFRKPHYLLLNFALGGDWGGDIDDSKLPQKYLIDYVRVYQQQDK